MIRARFEIADAYGPGPTIDQDMPYPPHVGDWVELEETGQGWEVTAVAWVLPPANDPTAVTLIVKLK